MQLGFCESIQRRSGRERHASQPVTDTVRASDRKCQAAKPESQPKQQGGSDGRHSKERNYQKTQKGEN